MKQLPKQYAMLLNWTCYQIGYTVMLRSRTLLHVSWAGRELADHTCSLAGFWDDKLNACEALCLQHIWQSCYIALL